MLKHWWLLSNQMLSRKWLPHPHLLISITLTLVFHFHHFFFCLLSYTSSQLSSLLISPPQTILRRPWPLKEPSNPSYQMLSLSPLTWDRHSDAESRLTGLRRSRRVIMLLREGQKCPDISVWCLNYDNRAFNTAGPPLISPLHTHQQGHHLLHSPFISQATQKHH